MLAEDPAWAERASRVAGLTRDVTEVMGDLGIGPGNLDSRPIVAYHSACSMQHGQKLREGPKRLLRDAGFDVREPAEGHLCCGSAGTYNMLQPAIAKRLQNRKVVNLEDQNPDIIATGNIGCLVQISDGTNIPVVHTVELLDWASGGPRPEGLA